MFTSQPIKHFLFRKLNIRMFRHLKRDNSTRVVLNHLYILCKPCLSMGVDGAPRISVHKNIIGIYRPKSLEYTLWFPYPVAITSAMQECSMIPTKLRTQVFGIKRAYYVKKTRCVSFMFDAFYLLHVIVRSKCHKIDHLIMKEIQS